MVCMQAMVPRLATACLAMAHQLASQAMAHPPASLGMDPRQVSRTLPCPSRAWQFCLGKMTLHLTLGPCPCRLWPAAHQLRAPNRGRA